MPKDGFMRRGPLLALVGRMTAAVFASCATPGPAAFVETKPAAKAGEGLSASSPPPARDAPSELDAALASTGALFTASAPDDRSQLAAIDLSDGVDGSEAEVIAGIYWHFSDALDCGGIDTPMLEGRWWRAAVRVGVAGERTGERVVVDAASGGVWGLGRTFRTLAAFRKAVEKRAADRSGRRP